MAAVHFQVVVYKKNEMLPFETTWKDFEGIIPSAKVRERQILYGITYMCNPKNTKTNEHNFKKKQTHVVISGREPI